MNAYLVSARLVIFLIALLSVFILYTAYLVKKYGFLNKKRGEITKAYREFHTIYEADRYFTNRDLTEWLKKYDNYQNTIEEYRYHVEKLSSIQNRIDLLKPLLTSYINAFLLPKEYGRIIEYIHGLYSKGEEIIKERNKEYIEKELEKYDTFFSNMAGSSLTLQQRRAIITDETNNLIVAGAGTGKTLSILGKTSYILEKQYAEPEEILILTFTDNARKEIEKRINKHVNTNVEVRTFRTLCNEIIGKANGKLPSLHKTAEDEAEFTKTIQNILSRHMKDFQFANKVNQYFSYYMKPVENKYDFKTSEEYESYLETVKPRSLKSDKVKSIAELTIANYLYLNQINYTYENPYIIDTADTTHTQYKPDFYLPDQNIWIEHIDIDRQCNTAPDIDRDEYMDSWYWKRKTHRSNHTELIETYSYQLTEGTITDSLQEMLQVRGVKFQPIPEDKIFNRLRQLGEVNTFIALLIRFLRLYKSNKITFPELTEKARNHVMSKRYLAFLEIFKTVLVDYEEMLKESECIDFDDMINQATDIIEQKQYQTQYKYIMIDEFQDISPSRYRLVKALLRQNPEAKTFCVGDECIYSFTGSEVSLMTDFSNYFNPSIRCY